MFRAIAPFLLLCPVAATAALPAGNTLAAALMSGAAENASTTTRTNDFAPRLVAPAPERSPVLQDDLATTRLGPHMILPAELRVDPLAGHLGFAAAQSFAGRMGWGFGASNNALGVGLTETFGARMSRSTVFSAFGSFDYNRVDSDRQANAASPIPYAVDNADIGLTGTLGVALTRTLTAKSRTNISLYSSVVAGSSINGLAKEAATFGSRVLQSIDSGGPERIWSEVGAGGDLHISARTLLRASLVETIGHPHGDALAARVKLSLTL
jgi:hypothetical protein